MSDAVLASTLAVSVDAVTRARAVVSAVHAMPLPETVRTAILSTLGSDSSAASHALQGAADTALDRGISASDNGARWVETLGAYGTPTTRSMALQQLASSAGEQLTATHDNLENSRHPLRLGDVRLTLRGALANEADQLAMRFDEAALVPGAVSEVVLEYRKATRESEPKGTTEVPDISGYTRSLAVRKVEAAGLTHTVAVKLVTSPNERGRVVYQEPSPGVTLERGQSVSLYLGRLAQEVS